MLNKFI